MKFTISKTKPQAFHCDIISIGCYERSQNEEDDTKQRPALIKLADGGIALDKALGGALSKQILAEKFTGRRGTSRMLFTAGKIPANFILLTGLGPKEKYDLEVLREAGAAMARSAREVKANSVALVLEPGPVGEDTAPERARAITEGVILGGYRFDRYKTENGDEKQTYALTTFLYSGNAVPVRAAIEEGRIVAEATCFCRDIANTPASDATPAILAKHSHDMARKFGLECTVLGTEAIRKARMNGLLEIAKGSEEPPAFIIIKYRPKEKPRASLALVGKGVTFDSGGLSLKQPKSMETMKEDKSGAAAVMATMRAIAQFAPPVAVTAYIPAAENLPDGRAVKPGDIYTARNGKTVEVVNTDAEGRLLLADALTYAVDHKHDAIVDIATLTGAAAYCCGELYALVVGNDQKIVDRLRRAAEISGEYVWQLPIVEQYKRGFTSGIADLNNVGKGKAQTINASIFLREFVGKTPWAHLDIAACSWTEEELPLSTKGSTGTMVRTLTSFVLGFKKTLAD